MLPLKDIILDCYIKKRDERLFLTDFLKPSDIGFSGIVPGTDIPLEVSVDDSSDLFLYNSLSFVLSELMSNAVEAYGEWNGTEFSPYEVAQGLVRVGINHQGDRYFLRVRDYGVGMSENTVRTVLISDESTTKPLGEGIGFNAVVEEVKSVYSGRVYLMSQGKMYGFGVVKEGDFGVVQINSHTDFPIEKGTLVVAELVAPSLQG